jgi:hypothetical protein
MEGEGPTLTPIITLTGAEVPRVTPRIEDDRITTITMVAEEVKYYPAATCY